MQRTLRTTPYLHIIAHGVDDEKNLVSWRRRHSFRPTEDTSQRSVTSPSATPTGKGPRSAGEALPYYCSVLRDNRYLLQVCAVPGSSLAAPAINPL